MKKIFSLFLFILIGCGGNNQKASIESENESSVPKEINIILSSNDNMLFDKQILYAYSRQKITLTLNHNGKLDKKIMGHNFVLLKTGVDVVDFATRALEARENDYIPEGDEIISYTKLIGGGESDTITFDAPTKGTYNYICTFPGHYGIMKGILVVK